MKKKTFKNAKLVLNKQKISDLKGSKVYGGSIPCTIVLTRKIGETIGRVTSRAFCPVTTPISAGNGCLDTANDHSCQCNLV